MGIKYMEYTWVYVNGRNVRLVHHWLIADSLDGHGMMHPDGFG